MILDNISNWKTYFKSPIFELIFETLKTFHVDTADGIYHYDGFYFKVLSYETKTSPMIIESHRNEVDIQILLKGVERVKLYHLNDLNVIEEYNPITDCILYSTNKSPHTELTLIPEFMAVFFPSDPHHPQFHGREGMSKLKKVVIKVKLNNFK